MATLSETFAGIDRPRALLGTVSKDGTVYFTHKNSQECRRFLQMNGLKCTLKGWRSPTHTGAIYFDGMEIDGKSNGLTTWTAAFWRD